MPVRMVSFSLSFSFQLKWEVFCILNQFSQLINLQMETVKLKVGEISNWATHTLKKAIYDFNEGSIDEIYLFGEKVFHYLGLNLYFLIVIQFIYYL